MSEPRQVSRTSLFIAAFSTVVEWYDFTLYLYLTTVLARVFYGDGEGSVAMALLVFAIGYLMRPVGAACFGFVGDRFGRRRMMLWSMGLMTLAMIATALLPTSAAIGGAAAWLLLALRLVMAFAVGGEYTGVVAYLSEGSSSHRRGFIASLAAASSEVGALLASAAAALTVWLLPEAELDAWGWRLPFAFGAVMALVVWIARSRMDESPEFTRQVREQTVPRAPAKQVLTTQLPAVIRTFAISALGSVTYYVGITYVPSYLTTTTGLPESAALGISTLAAAVVIAVTPILGWASDRVGRKPILVGLAAVGVFLPVLAFWAMGSANASAVVVLGVVLLAVLGGGVSAVAASATAEQFTGEGRVTGLAFGVTAATAVFGGLAPWVSELWTNASGNPIAPGFLMAIVAIVAGPVIATMPETARHTLRTATNTD